MKQFRVHLNCTLETREVIRSKFAKLLARNAGSTVGMHSGARLRPEPARPPPHSASSPVRSGPAVILRSEAPKDLRLVYQTFYCRPTSHYDGTYSKSKPLKLTKTLKVFIIEAGMLSGIVVAGYTLPGNTPLNTFVIASAACFLLGNILLIRQLRNKSYAPDTTRGFWPHILRALTILAVC
jgi:hypothetical protein